MLIILFYYTQKLTIETSFLSLYASDKEDDETENDAPPNRKRQKTKSVYDWKKRKLSTIRLQVIILLAKKGHGA